MALGSSLGGNAFTGGAGLGGGVNAPSSGGYFGGSGGSGFGGVTSMSSAMGGGGGMGGSGWGGLIGAGISLIGGLFGASQRRKANKLAQQTVAPEATINPELVENRALARQAAQVGMPQAQYNQALQNIRRSEAGALRAAQTSGRPSSVANILRQTNDATLRLDAADAAARQANQRTLMGTNTALAADRNRIFGWDQQQYLMALQEIAGMRQQGSQNIMGAVGLLGNVAMSGAFDGLFSGNRSGNSSGGGWLGGLFGGGSSTRGQQISGGASMAGVTPSTQLTNATTLPYS